MYKKEKIGYAGYNPEQLEWLFNPASVHYTNHCTHELENLSRGFKRKGILTNES